jgi:hypothetical protein
VDHYRPTRYPRDSKQQRHHDQTIARACSSKLPSRTSSHEQTRALLEARLAERPQDQASLTALAWVYVCLERNADAVRVARQAADSLPIEKDALSGPYLLAGLAEIEARTGQAKEAIKILRRLIISPAGGAVSVARLKIDPVWDPIRNDPDFQKLISEPEAETIYK